ncbi:MAG: single-stranded-DNA-specific exonuclease RecJ [Proteobacteria bacterium]|nr:single-stranded-DNA-specific exonuclease RecJ [Pseudomonadota bacterium]
MVKIKRREVPNLNPFEKTGFSPLIQRLYLSRGITQLEQIQYKLSNLHTAKKLSGIKTAASIVIDAINDNKKIVIVGDFDADGATATALCLRAIKAFGHNNIDYLVPNRFDFGYGLSAQLIPILQKMQTDLIITVDNGISSIKGTQRAIDAGMQVIITDHHLPAEVLPSADAIVNPSLNGDEFPSKNLAGVGVVFYLLAEIRSQLNDLDWFVEKNIPVPNLAQWLDIVALGTVADMVGLDDNNRILVTEGIKRIKAGYTVAGIKALMKIAGKELNKTNTDTFGFVIAPRLNAAGRLEDMSIGIELLTTDDDNKAYQLAQELDSINQQRKEIQKDMQRLADSVVNELDKIKKLPDGICLYHKDWHQGVVGLLASKVKEKTNRPVIAFAPENDESDVLKGSARSITGFHIRDALVQIETKHPNLMHKFGGHAMAAGLSLNQEDYPKFREIFNLIVKDSLTEEQRQHTIHTDGELDSMDLCLAIAEELQEHGPWGQNFPAPLFDGWFNIIDKKEVGTGHTKLTLQTLDFSKRIGAIAFGIHPKFFKPDGGKNQITFKLDINEFRGRRSLQLIVQDIIN